ncbi:hypothetical protein GC197_18410 [bacterium]|nr:hypothetical protein [bacterium]
MAEISRRDLVLLLVGLDKNGHAADTVGGITRLQKFLFLLEKEAGLTPKGNGFEFQAYKAGPYSSKLYDDLEFLENLDLLWSEVEGEMTEAEATEVDMLDFDDLINGDDGDQAKTADSYEERKYSITDDGKKRIEELIHSGEFEPVAEAVRKIKSKFGNHSLNDLLYYVYTKFPEMTTESEIKEKVLRQRRRSI